MMIDYLVFLLDGMTVNEAVTENEDGSYTIFINERLCEEKRLKSFRHALNHITNFDFEKEDVQEIEYEAHTDE